MLLTLPAPVKREFDFRAPHEFADQRYSPPASRQFPSSSPKHQIFQYQSAKSPAEAAGINSSHSQMTGNPQHSRNLPPPPPLSLPDPRNLSSGPHSGPHSASHLAQTPLGTFPPPPSQWQGHEEYMRTWLLTKSEEEKRKQEEEKSRQEHYRLEQRRLEHSMLLDGIRAGIPPHFLPMLCLAITGGANLASIPGVPEVIQQYLSAVTGGYKGPPGPSSPEATRNPPGPPHQPMFTSQAPPPSSQPPGQGPFGPFPGPGSSTPRGSYSGPASQRGQSFEMLPRLTTAPANLVQGTAGGPNQAAESPIYFHHWTPPTSQSGGTMSANQTAAPPTPSGEFLIPCFLDSQSLKSCFWKTVLTIPSGLSKFA